MKVVTASAALDSGEFDPTTTLNANSGVEIGGVPLANSGGQDFGTIDMTAALTGSVNTYWAQVGEQLGAETYLEYMDRFGFNADPKLDYPDSQMAPSGVYSEGKLLTSADAIDIGRVAIGQERRGELRRPRSRWRRWPGRSRTTACSWSRRSSRRRRTPTAA